MSLMKPIQNWLSYSVALKQRESLLAASRNSKQIQIKRLKRILAYCAGAPANSKYQLNSKMSPQDFAKSFPVTDLEFWSDWIGIGKSNNTNVLIHDGIYGSKVARYQLAGSNNFPVSTPFMNEVAAGLMAALGEMYTEMAAYPLERPTWMLISPTESYLGALSSLAGGPYESIPLSVRWSFHSNTVIPSLLVSTINREAYLFATVAWLSTNQKLSAIAISSPNVLLELANTANQHREVLSATLSTGAWKKWSDVLENVPCPKSPKSALLVGQLHKHPNAGSFQALWPRLKSLYSFCPAEIEAFSSQFWKVFPHVHLFDFGLWVNEGIVTVRIGSQNLLALNSHYYEFEDVSDGNLIFGWELETGMNVKPIISNSAGLLRCRSNVVLKVKSFFNQCPCFEYVDSSVQ